MTVLAVACVVGYIVVAIVVAGEALRRDWTIDVADAVGLAIMWPLALMALAAFWIVVKPAWYFVRRVRDRGVKDKKPPLSARALAWLNREQA